MARTQYIIISLVFFLSGKAIGSVEPFPSEEDTLKRKRNYLLTGGINGAILAGGAVWYVTNESFNAPDFVYQKMDKEWFYDRFQSTNGHRYDKNKPVINTVGHPLAGALYYYAGRLGNFRVGESIVITGLSSSVWEYLIEFKEHVSINDQLFTIFGGVPFGEFFHQTTQNLFGKSSRFALRTSFNASTSYQNFRPSSQPTSDQFFAKLAMTNTIADTSLYLPEGKRYFNKPFLSTLDAYAEASTPDQYAYYIGAYTHYLGWKHSYKLENGTSNTIWLAPHFGLDAIEESKDVYKEHIGALHLFGITSEYAVHHKKWSFIGNLKTSFDFASTLSLASTSYLTEQDKEKMRASLREPNFPYYHGWGGTIKLSGKVERGQTSLVSRIVFSAFSSKLTEGKDVHQEEVELEPLLKDSKFTFQVDLNHQFGKHWGGRAMYEFNYRKGTADFSELEKRHEKNIEIHKVEIGISYSLRH